MNRQFTDFNVSFVAHPVTGDIVKVHDEQAIKQSLRNMIMTNFYDAPFQPRKGSSVRNILFEPVSHFTVTRLKDSLTSMIDMYEPRVNIVSLVVSLTDDETAYHIYMTYSIINTIEPLTLNFLLQRIR